jgi:AraC family transcriptional regulator of adaptative response/methylated-DNA-[protein]-cysteine methyltransferase
MGYLFRVPQESGGHDYPCRYNVAMGSDKNFELVARALRWIADNRLEQPGLKEISDATGISPHHLQRVFQQWAGVSPKQFLRSLTRTAALERLCAGETVLDSALASGLSGPGRLHDLLISTEALTPGEIRKKGEGTRLHYGFGECVFGHALVSWNERGINFLGFCNEQPADVSLAGMKSRLERAEFMQDKPGAQNRLDRIFERGRDEPLPVWLRGSPFQLKVWEALLHIPEGANATYGAIARYLGSPGAAQAVGNAVGGNPVSWIIPCHRVIRQMGETGGYRWGAGTKAAMIGLESVGAI